MAKAQTFQDKLNKKSDDLDFKMVKVIYSTKSSKTGAYGFNEKFMKIPADASEDQFIKEELEKISK